MRVANALVNSFFITLACVVPATAQVQQGGSVTRGHVATWGAPGVVMDGGTATAGQINSLGLYGNGGTPLCISSSATPAPYSGSYWLQCEGVSSTAGGGISLSGPSALPWSLTINGTTVLTATQAGVSIPSLTIAGIGSSSVTGNGVANTLSTWMSYLAGVANPNSLLEASGANITVQGTGIFQVGGSLGPAIRSDGAADTVSIQAQPGALPSTTNTNLQLYPPAANGGVWMNWTILSTHTGSVENDERLIIGSNGTPGNYIFSQVVQGSGACHQVDFLDGLTTTPAWSLSCNGYLALPNNVGIWGHNAAGTADENLMVLDATNTLDLGYGAGGVAIPVKVDGALSVAGNASVGGTLTIATGTPASSSAACTQGQIEFDAAYVYTCVATNTWRRAASSAF